jgi:predicted acetyltransferase
LLQDLVYLSAAPEDYNEKLKNPLEHSEGYETMWAGFDGSGKMCSVAGVIDYKTRFDGHTADMGGAAGVATLAEARFGGYVRKIFEKALPAMYEEGKIFSFLYPFDFSFYRKFGYELCYSANRLTIPMYLFKEFKYAGGFEQYFPGGDIAGLTDVYNAFIEDKNLALVRDEGAMRERIDKDPYTERRGVYMHRDTDGRAAAYIAFDAEDGDGGREMNVREIAWTSAGAFHAVLGFIGALAPEFASLKWDAPRGLDMASFFADPMDIKISNPPGGMNRIVNVRRAFGLMAAPEQPGRAVISVTDASLPVNGGVYELEWDKGAVRSVKLTKGQADMDADVQTLAQLVTGYLQPEQAVLRRGAVINGNRAALRGLFTRKDLYIAEHF